MVLMECYTRVLWQGSILFINWPVRVLPGGTPTVDPHCMDALRAKGHGPVVITTLLLFIEI